MRAEILGAFFNAVFLIALCMSIILEAITRFVDPPVINNPMLILIVGCTGLASNGLGFFVLGGHGHSHGPEEHDHGDEVRDAEEGNVHNSPPSSVYYEVDGNTGNIGDIFPEAVVARAQRKSSPPKRYSKPEDASTADRRMSQRKSGRRSSSSRRSRFGSIDDMSIHPATMRQDIIAASRPSLEGIVSEENSASDGEAIVTDDEEGPTENTSLLAQNGHGKSGHKHRSSEHSHPTAAASSAHKNHNHSKPQKPSTSGHGHNHADMGMNAMILHVIGDALGNAGVIVSALVIWLTNWSGRYYADPTVSMFITLIILKSALPLTSASAKILLQATPDHIDIPNIREDIQAIPGVLSCHHVHVWQLSDTQIVASMHIQVAFAVSEANGARYMELARAARQCLHAYGIHSATIQPEFCLDQSHDHIEGTLVGLDGATRQPTCGLDDDNCLLGCVDNCKGKGCCSTPASGGSQHEHDHDGPHH